VAVAQLTTLQIATFGSDMQEGIAAGNSERVVNKYSILVNQEKQFSKKLIF
jgi:hypothetical protein